MAKERKSLALLEGLVTIKKVLGWTYEDIRQKINEHLPEDGALPKNTSSLNQIERWMSPERKPWAEPRADIILAIQAVVEIYGYLLKK